MTTLFQERFICGCCNHEFNDVVIGSFGYANKDSDLRPNYWGLNPLPYFVHCCAHCGYTAYDIGQTPSPPLRDWLAGGGMQIELQNLERRLAQTLNVHSNGWLKYWRAAICAEHDEADAHTIAQIYLHMSWLARAEEALAAEKYAQMLALTWFHRALELEVIPRAMQTETLYLIGELHRRLGEFTQAVALFDAAIAAAWRSENSRLLRLARLQRELAECGDAANTVIGEER